MKNNLVRIYLIAVALCSSSVNLAVTLKMKEITINQLISDITNKKLTKNQARDYAKSVAQDIPSDNPTMKRLIEVADQYGRSAAELSELE